MRHRRPLIDGDYRPVQVLDRIERVAMRHDVPVIREPLALVILLPDRELRVTGRDGAGHVRVDLIVAGKKERFVSLSEERMIKFVGHLAVVDEE
jgi:hypothetical protein